MSVWKSLKKGVKKVVKTVKKIVRTAKELAYRIIGLLDFIGSLIGIRPRKYFRAKVVVLADAKGPVVSLTKVDEWWTTAVRVFKDEANVELNSFDSPLNGSSPIMTMPIGDRTDVFVLPECSISEMFSDISDWYEDRALEIKGGFQQVPIARWGADNLGIGEAVVAFVIRDIGTSPANYALGCSYPAIAFHAVVAGSPAKPPGPRVTTLAHELAHLCLLKDMSGSKINLMSSDRGPTDSHLSRTQVAVLRNSRFVTYIKRTS
jgi:hypothetical protein